MAIICKRIFCKGSQVQTEYFLCNPKKLNFTFLYLSSVNFNIPNLLSHHHSRTDRAIVQEVEKVLAF